MNKDDILKEARDRLAQCIKHDAENRREAAEDHRFLAGDQWPDDMRRLRQVEARPCLTINKLPAFVNQVLNDQRQNRPSIKVHPVDSVADPETAEVIQGAIRWIEYNSNADICQDTAVQHATIGGFGYFGLMTDYVDPQSFDQDIKFRRIPNPFSVYIDPFSTEPDGSDMLFCFVTELMSRAEFKAQYPKADANNAETLVVGGGDTAVVWMSDDSIRVAEYYAIRETPATLCRLNDGTDVFEDELPPGAVVVKKRKSEKRKVCWYKITGVDVLEETEIPCKWIPVFPVYGMESIVDGRIRRSGLVRFARDPQRMYNFWMTSATEEVSLRPKAPFIGAVGQFETAKKDWRQANTRSFAFLEYDPVDANGTIVPPPQRQQMADVPTGVLAMAMHASDNIKATTGIFDASLGAQGNETSGKAITARQREGDKANFHFADNLARTIRHAGRCIVDMLPKVYDTPRMMRILGPDEKMEAVQVNAPVVEKGLEVVMRDLTVGKYDVTIGVGPSYSTQRAEAVDAMMQVGQVFPNLWAVAGDKIVRSMDWPNADEIADRLKKALPPGLADEEDQPEAQPMPPEVQEALTMAAQEIEQLRALAAEAKSGIDKVKADGEVKLRLAAIQAEARERELAMQREIEELKIGSAERIAELNNDTKRDIEELKGLIALLAKKLEPPPPELGAEVGEDLKKEPSKEGFPTSGVTLDQVAALIQQMAATQKPRRMSIVAPSGITYMADQEDDETTGERRLRLSRGD